MMTPIRIKTHVLLLALSAACTVTCAAAESVPYDLKEETYKTTTLFSYDGCMNHHLMENSGQPFVFKNYVYVPIIAYGRHPRVLQVPLDGGQAKIGRLDPDFVVNDDSHRYFTLGVDKEGYIHLTGGMHGSVWQYWVSAKPEDVSEFVRATPGERLKQKAKNASKADPADPEQPECPPGAGITYPHYFTDAAGNLFLQARGSVPSFQAGRKTKTVMVELLSMYDADTRSWRLLGDDIPKAFGGHPGHPVTAWTDNFSNGQEGVGNYARSAAYFHASRDNTLHFLFKIMNYSPQSGTLRDSDEGGGGKDLLYAWSKDGGKTLHRVDGSNVEWPVQAEAGPHQPDVLYAAAADYAEAEKNGTRFAGLTGGGLQLDWKDRLLFHAHNIKAHTDVVSRLENGKWVPCSPLAFGRWRDSAGVLTVRGDDEEEGNNISKSNKSNEITRLWDQDHMRVVKLEHRIDKFDEHYFRETGTMVYTTKSHGQGNEVINIVKTTIQRPDVSKTGK